MTAGALKPAMKLPAKPSAVLACAAASMAACCDRGPEGQGGRTGWGRQGGGDLGGYCTHAHCGVGDGHRGHAQGLLQVCQQLLLQRAQPQPRALEGALHAGPRERVPCRHSDEGGQGKAVARLPASFWATFSLLLLQPWAAGCS